MRTPTPFSSANPCTLFEANAAANNAKSGAVGAAWTAATRAGKTPIVTRSEMAMHAIMTGTLTTIGMAMR